MLRSVLATVMLVVSAGGTAGADEASTPQPAEMRSWIESMKNAPRGPFERIRWFCEDGAVLPPGPYVCRPHGGGIQHGEWNEQAGAIRAQGYPFATLLAELDPDDFLGPDGDHQRLREILLERFLIRVDDGWVFRRARYYRGAIQVEDEQRQARALMLALLDDSYWRDPKRFVTLREAARLLPVDGDRSDATLARDLAIEIADADPGFQSLRVKLHGLPDAGDAERVRQYARDHGAPGLNDRFQALADALDRLYAPQTAIHRLEGLARAARDPELARWLLQATRQLEASPDLGSRLARTGTLAASARERTLAAHGLSAADRLLLLQAGLALEDEAYAIGSQLTADQEGLSSASRAERLSWLDALAQVLYGAGLLSGREQKHFERTVAELQEGPLDARRYADGLAYLARAVDWAQRSLAFAFDPAITHWAELTPLVGRYIPDRLRDSPLLVFSRVIDPLRADASARLGASNELFGQPVSAGLRALNPGLHRGVLRRPPGPDGAFDPDGIYLLPETTAELPPVAGILTRGEGSSLSHVQLLARNLGIPNVVVGEALLPRLESHLGERVVLAVSPGGRVQLARDGPGWDSVLSNPERRTDPLAADRHKLDLRSTDLIPLHELRADDAGRRVGPKAANLGELAHHYPDQVSPGVAIPFGVFRQLLDRPIESGGPAAIDWLRDRYRQLAEIDDRDRRRQATAQVLAHLRDWITTVELPSGFRERLRAALVRTFGSADTDGVFVRSDTNVEDLPGFTGAGLNRTVANVVGFESILQAIRRVWASPFTERAFAWRQAHMADPVDVYPAVLLQATVPVDKSGVMVTIDLDSGDPDWLSIATSEGLGGAVGGQAAEELRINRETGAVRLLSQATAPYRREAAPGGGLRRVRADGPARLLMDTEIERLQALAEDVRRRVPLVDADGQPSPADIEFGFTDGRLALFQIRPLLENRRARASQYLAELDRPLRQGGAIAVDLDQPPRLPSHDRPR